MFDEIYVVLRGGVAVDDGDLPSGWPGRPCRPEFFGDQMVIK
jgi:hypothetical protein